MKKLIYSILIFSIAVLFSCGNKPTTDQPKFEELNKAKWFLGKWGNISPEGTMVEVWKIKNDSTYNGKTHFVIGTDTVFTETISLEQKGKELFYITQIPDQNDGRPISFKMISAKEKEIVFENPTHDFPQKIKYSQLGNDSLVAEISGMTEGKEANEKFVMGKMK